MSNVSTDKTRVYPSHTATMSIKTEAEQRDIVNEIPMVLAEYAESGRLTRAREQGRRLGPREILSFS